MSVDLKSLPRLVQAVHGKRDWINDPPYEHQLAEELKRIYGPAGLIELYGRFSAGTGFVDSLMRKVIWRALARRCGTDLRVGSGAAFKHPETFEIGHGVHLDTQTYLQGRHDGTCVIGNKVWIGPQAYLDARDLVLEDYVGWGPGAKIVGSTHTDIPHDLPIIATDLEIRPVRVCEWADIGANATILPGVKIGKGAIVGAGAVVVNDVEPFSVVAGVPARFLRWRKNSDSTAATP